MIISWSRAMAGAVKDPLVGRDLLIGCAAGTGTLLVQLASLWATGAATGVLQFLDASPAPLLGTLRSASGMSMTIVWAVFLAFLYLLLLLGLRRLLRREWAAILCAALIMTAPHPLAAPLPWLALPFALVSELALFAALARVGLVATVAVHVTMNTLANYPVTWPLTAWYSGIGLVGPGVIAALAFLGYRLATAPTPRARRSEMESRSA
jgi:serine/threonine-protein kinase